MRTVAVAAAIVFLAASCSAEPTLTEYAEDLETLVADMDAEFAALIDEAESAEQTMEEVQTLFDRQAAIFATFVDGFRELDPPPDAEELHGVSLRVLERRVEAEREMVAEIQAEVVKGGGFFEIIARLERSDALAELLEADEEVSELCRSVQDEFDATDEETELAEVPWVPELREVVEVSLNCGELPE